MDYSPGCVGRHRVDQGCHTRVEGLLVALSVPVPGVGVCTTMPTHRCCHQQGAPAACSRLTPRLRCPVLSFD
jgi:hypothetical protein